jgi:arylsulfatase A-like enzyme
VRLELPGPRASLRAVSTPLLHRRWPWLVAAGSIVVVFLSTFVELRLPGPHDPRPVGTADDIEALAKRSDVNVVFVLIDMLRADRLSSSGYPRKTSPTLDELASGGVRFARQLAQSSWTKASMASMWTGFNPSRTGITRYDHVVPEEALLPAEVLAKAGFRTVGLYRNGWVAPTFGFGQGFDVYKRPPRMPRPASAKVANPTISDEGSDLGTAEAAREFLRIDGRRQRWFLYVHLMDVHEYLYDEDSALFGSTHSDIYDNSIRHTDSIVGLIVDSVREAGFGANTLIAVTSDHGEALGERGFDGHAREVYRESTEVPFLISFPFRLESGVTVNTRTRNVDIWPTILDLLGLPLPPNVDGRSHRAEILALARGQAPPASDGTAIAHLDQSWGRPDLPSRQTVAVSENGLRYVRMERPTGRLEQLFDGNQDPAELHDRLADQPEDAERMRRHADQYLAEKPPWGEAPTRELDELELNQLRALGYAIP